MFEQFSTGRPKLKGLRKAVLLSITAHIAIGALVLAGNTDPSGLASAADAPQSAPSVPRPIGPATAASAPAEEAETGSPASERSGTSSPSSLSSERSPATDAAPTASIDVTEVNAAVPQPLVVGASAAPAEIPGAAEAALPHLAETAEIPARMQLGERHEFRFGLQPLTDTLLAGDSIRLLSVRQVELAGPGFRVESRTPPLQAVDTAAGAEWKWWITPTEPGAQPLDLRVDAIVLAGDQPRVVTLGTIRREVEVVLPPAQRIARFVAEHGGWFLLAGVVTLFFWLHSRRRLR